MSKPNCVASQVRKAIYACGHDLYEMYNDKRKHGRRLKIRLVAQYAMTPEEEVKLGRSIYPIAGVELVEFQNRKTGWAGFTKRFLVVKTID